MLGLLGRNKGKKSMETYNIYIWWSNARVKLPGAPRVELELLKYVVEQGSLASLEALFWERPADQDKSPQEQLAWSPPAMF
jgi:hypothetical protein